jgi:ABC-2 type transport system ATP-binding protein
MRRVEESALTETFQHPFAIEAVGLTKRYKDVAAVEALDLLIPHGSVFGFIGPNGAGKSTTIRLLMGLTQPTKGKAAVLGAEARRGRHPTKGRVGYVPESPSVYRWMRVEEAIGFCRSFYDRWDDKLCQGLRQTFDLDGRRKVGELSKGMLAKLGLLLALSHRPELLILDEPTAGLDPLVREEFLDGILTGTRSRSQTVFFSSHTLDDVERLADTVGILSEGRLLMEGPTDRLVASTKRVRAVLGEGAEPQAPPPGTLWQQVEAPVWELTVQGFSDTTVPFLMAKNTLERVEVLDLTLEDIFKDLIKGQRTPA